MKDVAIARTCLVRPSESDMFLLSEQWQRRLAASIQPKPYPPFVLRLPSFAIACASAGLLVP